MQELDPLATIVQREKLEEYGSGRSWNDGLTFSTSKFNLDWPYLVEALDEHDARKAALEEAGELQRFVDLSHVVQQEALRLAGLVLDLCRSPVSLCHLGFECERADAALAVWLRHIIGTW